MCVFQIWDPEQDAVCITGSNVRRSYAVVAQRKSLGRCKDNKQTLAGTLWRVASVARVAESIRTYFLRLGRATLRVNVVLQFPK